MKIGIFSDAFFPQLNGVVVYTIELVNYLASKGHKVYLIVPKCDNKDIKLKIDLGVEIIKIRGFKMKFYPDFKFTNLLSHKLLRFLKNKLDIINFQTPFTIGLDAILLGKITKTPIVGTFHTFIGAEEYMQHLPKFSNLIINKNLAWKYICKFYNLCQLIISPSEYTKKEIVENGVKNKVFVLRNAIDFSNYKNLKSPIKVNKDSLVYVGRIATEKNLNKLLEAFYIVTKNISTAKLYLAGCGPQFEEVKQKSKILGIEKKVIMLGRVENTIIKETDFLSQFKAFVTMSNTENQPITIIEAMRKGLPIIAPNAKGITEMITRNGFLVEPDDTDKMAEAIMKILKDKKLFNKFGKQSFENSKLYESEANFNILENKFKTLAEGKFKK